MRGLEVRNTGLKRLIQLRCSLVSFGDCQELCILLHDLDFATLNKQVIHHSRLGVWILPGHQIRHAVSQLYMLHLEFGGLVDCINSSPQNHYLIPLVSTLGSL
jgi:hypothetical protein